MSQKSDSDGVCFPLNRMLVAIVIHFVSHNTSHLNPKAEDIWQDFTHSSHFGKSALVEDGQLVGTKVCVCGGGESGGGGVRERETDPTPVPIG